MKNIFLASIALCSVVIANAQSSLETTEKNNVVKQVESTNQSSVSQSTVSENQPTQTTTRQVQWNHPNSSSVSSVEENVVAAPVSNANPKPDNQAKQAPNTKYSAYYQNGKRNVEVMEKR